METGFVQKRGVIFRDTSIGVGLANVEGNQKNFDISMWKSFQPPRVGMQADVVLDGNGQIVSLSEVLDSTLAKEQAAHVADAARRQGLELAGGIRKHFGMTVFVVEGILLISFFLLPSVSTAFSRQTLTVWDLLGIDITSFSSNDRGLLSLFAISLFAPLASPFLRKPWARWLYGAPLLYCGLIALGLVWQVNQAAARMRQATGGLFDHVMQRNALSMLHINYGIFLVLGSAVYLATRIFKPNR